MQNYPISLSPASRTNSPGVFGTGFWYESGTGSNDNASLIVTPERGSPITIRPGQWFRLPNAVGSWLITSEDATETITGNIIIGAGDFGDAAKRITLDATFANEVTVKNTAGNPVPVSIGGGANVPVTIAAQTLGNLTVQENLVAYTGSYTDGNTLTINTPVQLVAPGANVNGITVHAGLIQDSTADNQNTAFIAKATAPTGTTDGDLILHSFGKTTGPGIEKLGNKVRIPAGRGLYVIANHTQARIKSLTYTVH